MKVATSRRPLRVPGFRFAGVHCGLKGGGKHDMALIVSDVPASAAAAFTTNLVKAAPVVIGRERAGSGRLQAILVNSGNANAFTGRDGENVAREMCRRVAGILGVAEKLVLPSSTGRIGVKLPRQRVHRGIVRACRELSRDGFHAALEGIMTTDAFPKFASERLVVGDREVVIVGMAKGAGMIAPRMSLAGRPHATLLAYVLTDARVSAAALRRTLDVGLPQSFNSIVVDGDMSTNDTVVLLANGAARNPLLGPSSDEFPAFCGAVGRVMRELARMVVKDGEGATHVIDVTVRGARSVADAERVADAVARSPLCKAAFYGDDPYSSSRIVCAAGYSGARFEPRKLDLYLDDVCVVRRGGEVIGAKTERLAAAVAAKPEFTLTIDLHAGRGVARRVTSDLTVEYVRFNSAYRT